MVPITGSILFGLGMVLVFLSTTNYLVDAYLMYAASALCVPSPHHCRAHTDAIYDRAANAVLRSLFGAALYDPSSRVDLTLF
jgi:hypothetical protein